MKKVMFIDMMNTFIRNFASLPLSNDNGEHVGGVYGTLNSMVSVINKFNPDLVYCAWEGKGSSERRRKLLKEYKEGRKFTGFNRYFDTSKEEETDSFGRQLRVLKEIFDVLPVYQGSVDYLEADDVIAYMCTKTLSGPEYEKTIVSTDRDYWQLISDSVRVFRPVKSKGKDIAELIIPRVISDIETVVSIQDYNLGEEKDFKPIHPKNYLLTKCFGEKSDNIDGISGVGEKTIFKDFPFLVSLKENGDIYTISDLISHSQDQIAKGNKRYTKYISEDNQKLLLRNEQLIQLLEPDISLKARDSIEKSLTAILPKFNKFQFRIKLKREGISPSRIDSWMSAYSSVRPFDVKI